MSLKWLFGENICFVLKGFVDPLAMKINEEHIDALGFKE